MTEAYVKSEFHKGVTSIEFYHPQSNSLPGKLLHDMAVAIKRAGRIPVLSSSSFVRQEKRHFVPGLLLMN
jgi:hypothetical protein